MMARLPVTPTDCLSRLRPYCILQQLSPTVRANFRYIAMVVP
ncbi:unnamed protein product [Mycetohabitans rhizoxinica HKI 454]|uniref:Uncharacterized protein n=1 Tax=Mycetohabitans rhizoxinica (strain DSM 19002 / CIP 109453 / HKI 454) TaxID=882378 RepID=E5ATF8_MYCRK|nr:unnamed protein product [Mycetohabitans rhizoxinica HKI 454]